MENKVYKFGDLPEIKERIYHFANGFEYCNIYDSNEVETALGIGKYELVAAIGLKRKFPADAAELFRQIHDSGHWIFGYFEYQDIIHETHTRGHFYEPLIVICIHKGAMEMVIHNNGITESDFEKMLPDFFSFKIQTPDISPVSVEFKPQTPKADYLRQVETIKDDIVRGKYYEMNYCIEFKSDFMPIDFLPYFLRLNEKTRSPFAAYVRHPDFTLMCSSPERFLMKKENTLVSQPIKGTNVRLEGEENLAQMEELRNSEKERAENVMIVDLVRNDLARVCQHGSVKVQELCGIYPFKTVNHLISTVSGELKANTSFKEVIWSLFPMGSMTGAPKTEVMKHIKLYEHCARGIYSGCLGYIEPGGDFDFNVVIRSLVFDAASSEISYKVGSAITYDSVAEKEYEECLLKGRRLFEVMTS